MGAALAYYTLFSLAPLLLLVIAVAGVVFGADAARGAVVSQLGGLIGEEGSVAIQGLLKSASQPATSAIASVVSVATLIVGATSIFGELQSDLDRIWRAPAANRPAGLWGLVKTRLLSFGLIVSIGFLLLVSLVVSAGLAAFGKWYGAMFPGWVVTLEVVNQLVSVGFITALFAMMYRILPSVHVKWRDVWLGAFATAVLFTAGKFLIGLYIGQGGRRIGLRGRRFDRGPAGVGVLLRPDLSTGGGVHLDSRPECRPDRQRTESSVGGPGICCQVCVKRLLFIVAACCFSSALFAQGLRELPVRRASGRYRVDARRARV